VSESLVIDKVKEGDTTRLIFKGDLDENADFSSVNLGVVKNLVFDMGALRILNSIGIRSWLLWIKKFINGCNLVFVNCPHHVICQMNILHGFLPFSARVESFYIPYYCKSCDKRENILATRGKDFMEATADTKEGISISDEMLCPVCQQTMEIDVSKDNHFNFLKYRK